MPCKTEFYDTYQDQKHREQAKILNYAYGKLNKKEIKEEENIDYHVKQLCSMIRAMSEEERERFIYGNLRSKESRQLADWWEEHEKMDKARIAKEEHAKFVTNTINKAQRILRENMSEDEFDLLITNMDWRFGSKWV